MSTPTPGAAPQMAAEHTKTPRHYSEIADVSRSYDMGHICGVCGKKWGSHEGIKCPNGATVFSPVEIVGLEKQVAQLTATCADLLAALEALRHAPTTDGLTAHYRNEAEKAGLPNPIALADAALAKAKAGAQ